MRQNERQMTLGELIRTLGRKGPATPVVFDWIHFRPTTSTHSYRGYYEDLAIGYTDEGECLVAELLKVLKDANGKEFYGWKGGAYTMGSDTVVWVANSNEAGGTAVMDVIDDGWRIILKTEMID